MIRDFTDETKSIIKEAIKESLDAREGCVCGEPECTYQSELENTVCIMGQDCVMNFSELEEVAKETICLSNENISNQQALEMALDEVFDDAREKDNTTSLVVAEDVEHVASSYLDIIKYYVDSIDVSWMGEEPSSIRYNMGMYHSTFENSVFGSTETFSKKLEAVKNMESFKELENAMASDIVTDMLREEIGEEIYQALINGELSDEDMLDVLNIAAQLSYQYISNNIGMPGRYEIYICPNITAYAETTCSMELEADLPTSMEVSIKDDANSLLDIISINITSDNFGIEVGIDGLAANQTVQIDENSEYYYEVSTNVNEISVEHGVNTSISSPDGSEEIQTSVAVGATYTPGSSNNGWEPVTVTDSEYENVPQPEVVVELQEVPVEMPTVEPVVHPSNVGIMQHDIEISGEGIPWGWVALAGFVVVVIIIIEISPLGRLTFP